MEGGDEKIGGNGVEGTFNKDMTNDEMTFLDRESGVRSEKKRACAYGEVLSVHTPSRSWQLPLSGRGTDRKKSEKRARVHMESGFR